MENLDHNAKEMIIEDIEKYPRSTQEQRADRLGVHVSTLRARAKRYCIKLPVRIALPIEVLKKDIKEFPDSSQRARARRLGVDDATVSRVFSKIIYENNK